GGKMRASGVGQCGELQFDAARLAQRLLEKACRLYPSSFALRDRTLHDNRKGPEARIPERARQLVRFDGVGARVVERSSGDRKVGKVPERHRLQCLRPPATGAVKRL